MLYRILTHSMHEFLASILPSTPLPLLFCATPVSFISSFHAGQVVVEPSGAAGLAAVLSPGFTQHPEWSQLRRVAIVLSGGNVDLQALGLWDQLNSRCGTSNS